jgi:hypothetical protein
MKQLDFFQEPLEIPEETVAETEELEQESLAISDKQLDFWR